MSEYRYWRRRAVDRGQVNLTDADSKLQKTTEGYLQGYNAQAVVNEQQIVLAAELTNSTVDWSQLDPMVSATLGELGHAGVSARPEVALADAQYWNEEHMDEVMAHKHIQMLIPPYSGTRKTPRPGRSGGRYTWMRYVLASSPGRQLYRKRKHLIEQPPLGTYRGPASSEKPGGLSVVFGVTEHRRMATHNLTKLHRHQIATGAA